MSEDDTARLAELYEELEEATRRRDAELLTAGEYWALVKLDEDVNAVSDAILALGGELP